MKLSQGNFKWKIVLLDLVTLLTGCLLYYKLANYFSMQKIDLEIVLPILSILVVLMFSLFDLYTDWRRKDVHNLVYSIILSMLAVFASSFVIISWLSESFNHHLFLASLVIHETFFVVLIRVGIWLVSKKMGGERKVIIIGEHTHAANHLAEKFLNHNEGWFKIEGILNEDNEEEIKKALDHNDLFIFSSGIKDNLKNQLVKNCLKHGKEVMIVPELLDLTIQSAITQQVDDMLFLSLSPLRVNKGEMVVKRIFDIIASSILLIAVSPLMIVMYIMIPLTSKGPVIFKQERVGFDGNSFWIYKFRSMIKDAEKKTGPVLATDKDPRITTFGRFMRSVRLDELPQLFNVLKGDMSLVGPRPEREYFITQFKQKLPDYTYRLAVKPGITGLAQVMGNYSTTVEDKLRYDLIYIRNFSLMLDLKILLQTIRVVIQRKQAKGVSEQKITQVVDMKEKGNVLGR